jgi:hypothetical protein
MELSSNLKTPGEMPRKGRTRPAAFRPAELLEPGTMPTQIAIFGLSEERWLKIPLRRVTACCNLVGPDKD